MSPEKTHQDVWARLAPPRFLDLGTGGDTEDELEVEQTAARESSPNLSETGSPAQAKTQAKAIAETPPSSFSKKEDRGLPPDGSHVLELESKTVPSEGSTKLNAPEQTSSIKKKQTKPVMTTPPDSSLDNQFQAGRGDTEDLSLCLNSFDDEQAGVPDIPRHQEGSSLATFAPKCVPVLMQMAGLPADTKASEELLVKVIKLLQDVKDSQLGATKQNAINEDHMETLPSIKEAAARQAAVHHTEEREAAKGVLHRSTYTETAAKVLEIQQMVGNNNLDMPLNVPPIEYALAELPEDSDFDVTFQIRIRDKRRVSQHEDDAGGPPAKRSR